MSSEVLEEIILNVNNRTGIKNDDIKKLLNDKDELIRLINYKRKEEKLRIGGIFETKQIKDFDYMKLNFNKKLINAFNKMQSIYVLDKESVISIEDVKYVISKLLEIFNNL